MSKYSFENTVGELLSDERVVKVVRELFPEILDNPVAALWKDYKLSEILPYVSGFVPQEKIDEFRSRLEKIK